jgi:hypothetical protein
MSFGQRGNSQRGVLSNYKRLTTSVAGNYTLTGLEQRIEIDASLGNVTLTLPEVTDLMKNRDDIEIVRIDDSLNEVNIIGINNSLPNSPIYIPIESIVNIYASNSNFWNDKGFKNDHILKMSSMSSGISFIGNDINSPADLITFPLLSDNGDGTFNINHSGRALIIDRSNPYYPKDKYPFWNATNNIPVGADGVYVLLINSSGSIVQHQYADQSSQLKATDPDFNTDNHIQLGTISVFGGLINSIQPVIQYSGNIANRLRGLNRILGVVNSVTEPIRIVPVINTLNIAIQVGDSSSADFGFVKLGAKAPDIDRVDPELSPALLVTALRDNTIIGASFDIDVTLFESSPGVTTIMNPNKFAVRWLISFTDFVGVILGKTEHNTAQLALDSNIPASIPPVATGGLLGTKIAVGRNVLNLNSPNAEFKFLTNFFE